MFLFHLILLSVIITGIVTTVYFVYTKKFYFNNITVLKVNYNDSNNHAKSNYSQMQIISCMVR